MKCHEISSLFTDYADNSLDAPTLKKFKGHLDNCAHCSREWREFSLTIQLVQGLEPVRPPADLLMGIHQKLAKKGFWSRFFELLGQHNFPMSIPAAATTFTLAMLAAFIVKNTPLNKPVDPLQPTRQNSEQIATRQPHTYIPDAMFAATSTAKHSEWGTPSPAPRLDLDQYTLPMHQSKYAAARHLLSPDLVATVTMPDQATQRAFLNDLSKRNWQTHFMSNGLLLIHVPQSQLADFHNLISQKPCTLLPPESASTTYGNPKKILTVAIRLQKK
ncbi:MAG: zf-HC2 domain-containing protein [Desulfobulbaceae bacterium]|nr:zf-HC2 domain-containing protein [Desulfobulbaceae bacterium]HIJ78059.1 zf-HC2 domain-containing protein [Deltaproteobacteria bacterium]